MDVGGVEEDGHGKQEPHVPGAQKSLQENDANAELSQLRARVEQLEALVQVLLRSHGGGGSSANDSSHVAGNGRPPSPAPAAESSCDPLTAGGGSSPPATSPPPAPCPPPSSATPSLSPQPVAPAAPPPAAPPAPLASTSGPSPFARAGAASFADRQDQGQGAAQAALAVPAAPPGLPAVAMPATRVVMHQLVFPADVNTLGICTGGQVLSWIDVCAGLSAKTLAHGPCVTASVDAVHFLRPCRLGCVVIIAAMVSRTFNTSMEVAVVVESEDMRTGVRHHCCSAHLTFVVRPRAGVCAASAPPGLPRVYPTNSDHRALWAGAEARRQVRLEQRTRVRRDPELQRAERICRLRPLTHREGGPTLPPAVTVDPRHASAALGRPSWSPAKSLPCSASPYPPASAAASILLRSAGGSSTGPAAGLRSGAGSTTGPTAGAAGAGLPSAPGSTADAGGGAGAPDMSDGGLAAGGGSDPGPLGGAAVAAAALDSAAAAVEAAAEAVGGAPPPRQLVPPGSTTAYMTQSILPQHANTLHITFGGQVMSWMEQCAYISASRLRAPAMLTAAMDSVSFLKPTRVGDILYITAQVTAVFGSSLEVMVSVFGESPFAGAGSSGAAAAEGGGAAAEGIFHCADAYVTVVAVDEEQASPVPVAFELEPKDLPDVLRYQGALARRAERLALRNQFAASEATRMSLDGAGTYSPPSEVQEVGSVLEALPPL